MYLARKRVWGNAGYVIRETVYDDGCLSSRDLFDLGPDPARYVVRPGGNAYYIHEAVCDRLSDLGVEPDPGELERVFWPFLPYETRRVIEGFSHAARQGGRARSLREQARRCETAKFHGFDQRRIHFLRFGQLDQTGLGRVPKKVFRRLLGKSRDEIEQYFLFEESCLRARERKSYVYVIFNLPAHFPGVVSRAVPGALPMDSLDQCFLEEICGLNEDPGFWEGFPQRRKPGKGLNEYLIRYACWFFDTDFEQSRYMEDLLADWIARHRGVRPPPAGPSMPTEEAAEVMGLATAALASITVAELTRQYRKMARTAHPDRGGSHEAFVRLGRAYGDLLRAVKAGDGKPGWRRR